MKIIKKLGLVVSVLTFGVLLSACGGPKEVTVTVTDAGKAVEGANIMYGMMSEPTAEVGKCIEKYAESKDGEERLRKAGAAGTGKTGADGTFKVEIGSELVGCKVELDFQASKDGKSAAKKLKIAEEDSVTLEIK